MAAEFTRYNPAPRLRVEGHAARAKRFSGVFDVDDPRSLVNLLATYDDLRIEERGEEILIQPR